ncbi:uncharacterized protein LOC125656359 [Ostrea edulis]|uniref:uncharacterized protein LOC125656359 n=1 Tax=Ostrea edulis TaxID=37623 RepID=UPI0024AF9E30|nr:uncharacterized protein LOC125656359 [Ostrea edulis]
MLHAQFSLTVCLCVLSILCKSLDEDSIRTKQSPFPEHLGKDVDDYVKDSHNALSAVEGSDVTLNCVNDVTRKVIRNFRQAKYRWIHNGMRHKAERGRVKHENGSVEFSNLKWSDGGSYLCQIEYEPYLVKTVGVYSLLVMPENPPVRVVQFGRRFCLQCNSAAIGHVYRYTKRNWIVNDKYTVFVNDIRANSVSEDCIEIALPKMSGDWTCVTSQEYSEKQWSTAFYRILVTPEPSIFGKLGNFLKENVIHAVLFAVGIALFCVSYYVAKVKKGGLVKNENSESSPLTTENKT